MAAKKAQKKRRPKAEASGPKTQHHKQTREFRRVAARLARRLRSLREDRGWTVNQAAEAYGMEPMSVWRLESGEANPTLATLVSIAGALRMSLAELLDET